jgi:hypothetical protein
VGLHHAGSKAMKGLEGSEVIEANEGIRIDAIIQAVKRHFSGLTDPSGGLQGAD